MFDALGFDVSTTLLHYFDSAGGFGTTVTITSGGRQSSSCVHMTGDGQYALVRNLSGNAAHLFACGAFKWSALPTGGRKIKLLTLFDAGTAQVEVWLNTNGKIVVIRGGGSTVLGTGTTTLTTNTFYHIELEVTVNNSTGAIKVYINGLEDTGITATGIDTQNSANAYANQVGVFHYLESGEPSITIDIDDVIVNDSAAVGDCHVREQLPSGTGSTDDGVAVGAATTRECVDDAAPNDDTDYARFDNVGDKSLWTYPAISTAVDVVAVGFRNWAAKTAAGTCTARPSLKIGGSDYNGADFAPSTTYSYATEFMTESPDTSSAWTPAEVNAMESGIERTA
jgi:hypothetical protein